MEQLITSRHFNIWQLIALFWRSKQRFRNYFFTILIIAMTIGLVAFNVVFNYWYHYFYNALQAYDKPAALRLLVIFFILAGFYIILAVYRFYLTQLFGLRWRKWLTQQLVNRWLKGHSYYYLENFDERTDNPDQRIQEDAGGIVTNSLDLFLGLISALTTFVAFIYILWQLSGILTIHLGPFGVLHLPGYLVWVSILYALIGTWFTFKIGHPLVNLNFEQQRREATFRFAAVDLRSHAEHVALYQGEDHQKSILKSLFKKVLDNWYLIILRQKLLMWFTSGYNQAAVVLPLVVVMPNYFNKVFLLGGLMQSLQAFSHVQDSLSYLVNAYTRIAEWQAIGARLTTFVNHLHDIQEKTSTQTELSLANREQNCIKTKNLSIFTPQKQVLLSEVDTTFLHGKNYLIQGKSGIGKSTFVRTLAGIWPFAKGEVILPTDQQIMFLPQKSFMPLGTLEEAILFPDKTYMVDEKRFVEILNMLHLEHLIPRLHETAAWSEQLSPGEQQRIAFARVLLHTPDWVFLDETTSMVDLANEAHLYKMLKKYLPNCSIVSVGHRPSLEAYHDETIVMEKYAGLGLK